MDVLAVQTALNNQGFSPGSLDGIWGRRTMLAVKAFQTAHGLKPDGVVGPLTVRALLGVSASAGVVTKPQDAVSGPLVWFEAALTLVGAKEDKSVRSNPEILQWAKDLGITDYTSDDIPWCGLFVAHCIGSSLPDEELPVNPLRARNWATFGEECDPKRGAVLVFWRGSEKSGNGHVGFYYSEDDAAYHVLGGNQSDSVNVCRVAKNRLVKGGARWPRTAATLTGAVVKADEDGRPLSRNEA